MSIKKQTDVLPELKQIIVSLLFAAKEPLKVSQIRNVIIDTGNILKGVHLQYTKVNIDQINGVIKELEKELEVLNLGLELIMVAGGYRFQNNMLCGPFVRSLLEKNKTMKLSKPALETLAIIAYRQPCLRSEVEDVRGVSVDAVVRKLIEMQLVKVVKRSNLPGKPWLFGTTQRFLEHFGINSVEELPGSSELKRIISKEVKSIGD
ncbi:MAG: SMC-Scp complex subunit ScpB [Pontiellaceae bacterium]